MLLNELFFEKQKGKLQLELERYVECEEWWGNGEASEWKSSPDEGRGDLNNTKFHLIPQFPHLPSLSQQPPLFLQFFFCITSVFSFSSYIAL